MCQTSNQNRRNGFQMEIYNLMLLDDHITDIYTSFTFTDNLHENTHTYTLIHITQHIETLSYKNTLHYIKYIHKYTLSHEH